MGIQIPCLLGDTKNTEGVPKSLGDLTQGCQILWGTGSPMTPEKKHALNNQYAPNSEFRLLTRVYGILQTLRLASEVFKDFCKLV